MPPFPWTASYLERAGSGYVQPDSSAKTPLAAIEELILIGYGQTFGSQNVPKFLR